MPDADKMLIDLERIMRGEPTGIAIHPRLPSCAQGSVLEYDWVFELDAGPDQLWRFITNTERLNHAVGIPAVLYTLPCPYRAERLSRPTCGGGRGRLQRPAGGWEGL